MKLTSHDPIAINHYFMMVLEYFDAVLKIYSQFDVTN